VPNDFGVLQQNRPQADARGLAPVPQMCLYGLARGWLRATILLTRIAPEYWEQM
jgi:hypothetical protein